MAFCLVPAIWDSVNKALKLIAIMKIQTKPYSYALRRVSETIACLWKAYSTRMHWRLKCDQDMKLLNARANVVSDQADRMLLVRRWLTRTRRPEIQTAGCSLS
jgi:hypothetical protein